MPPAHVAFKSKSERGYSFCDAELAPVKPARSIPPPDQDARWFQAIARAA